MTILDQVAERHIQQAAQLGEFDDLPGAGKPVALDDDALIPDELRAGYRLLKNVGYLPQEVQLTKEIKEVEQLLDCMREVGERDKAAFTLFTVAPQSIPWRAYRRWHRVPLSGLVVREALINPRLSFRTRRLMHLRWKSREAE